MMVNFNSIKMGWKKGTSLTLTLALGLTLAGCGSNANSTAKEASASANNSATNTQATDQKLVVYSAGPEGLANKIIEGFEAQTGVKVEMFQGTTGKILARMEAEKANPVVDVVILASLPSAQGLKNDGLTLPYPEAKNADKLNPDWSDKEGTILAVVLLPLVLLITRSLLQPLQHLGKT